MNREGVIAIYGSQGYNFGLTCFQRTSNCHSFKLAVGYDGPHAHENYTTITKTLSMDWDYASLAEDNLNTSFTVKFMTESVSQVEFQVAIMGEKLNETLQVSAIISDVTCAGGTFYPLLQVVLAAIILVWVYILIAFDVGSLRLCTMQSISFTPCLQVVHRTMAAFIGSTCTLAVLSMIDKVQPQHTHRHPLTHAWCRSSRDQL